jgi:FkbM family methyltransferase
MDESTAEGTLVGLAADADGRPEVASLPWRARGFDLRPAGRAFHRAGLFAETPRAQLELPLPAGEWKLVFFRHAWSGQILVRDAACHSLHDLYWPPHETNEYEVDVVSLGPEVPVVVEVAAQRNRDARAAQAWFVEVRKAPSAFHPEGGLPVSSTCRLINARHGTFLALRTDVGVAEELASTGLWEQQQVDLFSRLIRPGETALDIGANIGHHTVALSKIVGEAGKVIAFEPQMQMFNLLNANVVLNRCRNVLPFKLAVGHKAGKLKMGAISYDDFLPFGSLGLQREQVAAGEGESVDVVRLDDFIPMLGLDESAVSLLKVDVQAHELYVFRGAKEFLRRAQPTISFEVGPFWMQRAGYDWREVLALLQSLDYSFFDEAGQALSTPEWDGRSPVEWQILAVHPRHLDRLG